MPKAPPKNGTSYHKDTPPRVVQILEAARLAHKRGEGYRLRIHYGDPATGQKWGDHHSEQPCGYIGRSGGRLKVPLLLSLRTSIGGEAIFLSRIVKIEHANKQNGGVLYDITPSS